MTIAIIVALVVLALIWLAVLLNDSTDADEAREWDAVLEEARKENQ